MVRRDSQVFSLSTNQVSLTGECRITVPYNSEVTNETFRIGPVGYPVAHGLFGYTFPYAGGPAHAQADKSLSKTVQRYIQGMREKRRRRAAMRGSVRVLQ